DRGTRRGRDRGTRQTERRDDDGLLEEHGETSGASHRFPAMARSLRSAASTAASASFCVGAPASSVSTMRAFLGPNPGLWLLIQRYGNSATSLSRTGRSADSSIVGVSTSRRATAPFGARSRRCGSEASNTALV